MGPKALIRRIKKKSKALTFGSLVDSILFETKDEFNDKFFVFDGVKPTATLGKLANYLIDFCIENETSPRGVDILKLISRFNL